MICLPGFPRQLLQMDLGYLHGTIPAGFPFEFFQQLLGELILKVFWKLRCFLKCLCLELGHVDTYVPKKALLVTM